MCISWSTYSMTCVTKVSKKDEDTSLTWSESLKERECTGWKDKLHVLYRVVLN